MGLNCWSPKCRGQVWRTVFECHSDQKQQGSDWCLWERSVVHLSGAVTTIPILSPGSSNTDKLGSGMGKKGKTTCLLYCASNNCDRYLPVLLVPWISPSNNSANCFSEYSEYKTEIDNRLRSLLATALQYCWGKMIGKAKWLAKTREMSKSKEFLALVH